jgi:hypothetical protein
MINTSIPIFGELMHRLQLSLFTFYITKLKLIIYFREYHNGLPFQHSAAYFFRPCQVLGVGCVGCVGLQLLECCVLCQTFSLYYRDV